MGLTIAKEDLAAAAGTDDLLAASQCDAIGNRFAGHGEKRREAQSQQGGHGEMTRFHGSRDWRQPVSADIHARDHAADANLPKVAMTTDPMTKVIERRPQ